MECVGRSNLYMSMWNPLKFRFTVRVNGLAESYIHYYPNWYNTKPTVKIYQMPFSNSASGVPDMDGIALDRNSYHLASPVANAHDLTGYAERNVNTGWSASAIGMCRSLVYEYGGTTMKGIVEEGGCTSVNDALAYVQISGVNYTETGINSGSWRASRPKHVTMDVSISMDSFASDRPGLSYIGSFNSTSIFKYLTFSSITGEGGTSKPLGPSLKYRVLLDSGDSFNYGGYTWHYTDYSYTQVSAKSWKTWSDTNDTNIFDFTLNGSASYLTYETADIGQ